MISKNSGQRRTIPDVQVQVVETGDSLLQARDIPHYVALRPEEEPAHVIINAKNLVTLPAIVLDRLRANQAPRPRHKDFHAAVPVLGPGIVAANCFTISANVESSTDLMP